MAHSHLLSACAFCFLCLVHIHCSEHSAHVIKAKVAEGHDRSSAAAGEPPRPTSDGADSTSKLFEHFFHEVKTKAGHHGGEEVNRRGRHHRSNALPVIAEGVYIDRLFEKFQNNANMMDFNGFKAFLNSIGVHMAESRDTKNSTECLNVKNVFESAASDQEMASANMTLSRSGLAKICPLLLFELVEPHHCGEEELEDPLEHRMLVTWLYASGSVTIISLCGLFGVFVIPIMGKAFYQQVLQFLVALAVGTLCGDALLHLLPHALVTHHGHDHPHPATAHPHDHSATMWKGLAVLSGIVFFFFTEKILMLCSEYRKKQQRSRKVQGHSHVQILNGSNPDTVGEKLCKHKYSSYPYCYPDIKSNMDGHEHGGAGEGPAVGQELLEGRAECGKKPGEYDVIVREHTTSHHGHSHSHGHVHSAPGSLSSVAWMVILGDGLHNFTDGMALGAAFSNSIAGGCSTAVAVFCHELPHELGDFAVLLKTGMSAKQAVLYNLLSSVLCFAGMVLGMFVGSEPAASGWVFAVSAGMFLYIALVDMFPELTTNHSTVETSLLQCCLQALGMLSGMAVMLLIAFYEDHLLELFN